MHCSEILSTKKKTFEKPDWNSFGLIWLVAYGALLTAFVWAVRRPTAYDADSDHSPCEVNVDRSISRDDNAYVFKEPSLGMVSSSL